MKQVSDELRQYIHSSSEFYMCDLYEITLKSGLVLRYTSCDRDITLPDERTFSCNGPYFERTLIKISSGITVDKMNVTICTDSTDKISNIPIMQLAHTGGLDEATLTLYRCFMSSPGVAIGTVEMFGGYVDVNTGGGLKLKLTVKSGVQKLNVEYPIKKYLSTCPYSTYDNACGLNLANYTANGTVTAVTSESEFTTSIIKPDGYYEDGSIEWITGALTGISAPIEKSYQTGKLVMLIPLDVAPSVGDTFKVSPGCPKTYSVCVSKFNNGSRNRSTPYIPLKETIV